MANEKFKMWKLALASIHLDGKVVPEEREWFRSKINELANNKVLNFSVEEIQELQSVLDSPAINFEEEFEKLERPADCAILVHLLNQIIHVDHDLDPQEAEMLKKLEYACRKNVDQDMVDNDLKVLRQRNEARDSKAKNPTSLFERTWLAVREVLESL